MFLLISQDSKTFAVIRRASLQQEHVIRHGFFVSSDLVYDILLEPQKEIHPVTLKNEH